MKKTKSIINPPKKPITFSITERNWIPRTQQAIRDACTQDDALLNKLVALNLGISVKTVKERRAWLAANGINTPI